MQFLQAIWLDLSAALPSIAASLLNLNSMLLSVLLLNLGLGTLQRSTLRQKVLRRDYEAAAAEFMKFTKAGGKVLPGLVKRRTDEARLFCA